MPTKPLIIVAAIGGAAVAAAIGVNVFLWQDEAEVAPPPTETTARPAASPQSKISTQIRPSFDVVRIDPGGDAVMAGRAVPGSTVTILDNGKPIGEVVADERGEWVFVPTAPLSPGNRELTLSMRTADGKTVISDDVVVLAVPGYDKDIAGRDTNVLSRALVLKMPRAGGPSTVLQRPSGSTSPGTAGSGFSVETVDYDDAGRVVISGRAKAGARVNVYLNNTFIGRAKPDAAGIWRVSPDNVVKPGLYTLRADQINAADKVTARVSMPFSRAAQVVNLPPEPFVIVQPGNSLWRLARRTYGQGTRYTTIYQANKEQVKDPDLIFPGQVLALPAIN